MRGDVGGLADGEQQRLRDGRERQREQHDHERMYGEDAREHNADARVVARTEGLREQWRRAEGGPSDQHQVREVTVHAADAGGANEHRAVWEVPNHRKHEDARRKASHIGHGERPGELEERAHLSAHAQVLRHHGGLCSSLRCGVGARGPGLGAEALTVAHGAWAAAQRRRPSDGGRLPRRRSSTNTGRPCR